MKEIIIHEVGFRDGLQMEKQAVPFESKVDWINKIISAGVDIIQLGSFVHPERVPQMADTDKLFEHFSQPGKKPENIILSGLVLNERGMERGMKCGVDMFCMGVSASETHSIKNTRMSVEEATGRIISMAQEAKSLGKKVQVSVQSAFGCGFEGDIPEEKVLKIVKRYLNADINMISLADTAGHANPVQVERLIYRIRQLDIKAEIACHFHNTYGLGLANVFSAMKSGVKYIESAFGGLGGCPFTKLAAGNVCTEDLVHFLHRIDLRKEVDLNVLIEVAKKAGEFFGRTLPGYVYRSGAIKSQDII